LSVVRIEGSPCASIYANAEWPTAAAVVKGWGHNAATPRSVCCAYYVGLSHQNLSGAIVARGPIDLRAGPIDR